MIISIKHFLLGLLFSTSVMAQNSTHYTFDEGTNHWKIKKGNVELLTEGAYKGKSMRLSPNTVVSFNLSLQPASTYELTAKMRTESGTDNITMQINKLGNNNISASSALATWTKVERTFHVSAGQKTGELEFVFDDNQNNTHAWIDEITIKRTGDYKEVAYTGIPNTPRREVKTEMGITMQPDEKIKWMLDDKLGMFIHWGLYAGPAKGEWYMENQGVSIDKYRKLAYPESGDEYFDAKDFDARKWVTLAQKAGMKYVNMVTQHHDGYALFESKYMNAFTSKQTHNRDFVKEYVNACREAGLRVGLYKTLINWRFPGYYDVTGTNCRPDNKFGYTTAAWHKENARLMKEELYCQVKELMTNYGPIDQLFWDGGWLAQQGSDADGAYFWESGKYMNTSNEWPVNSYFQEKDEVTGTPLGLMGMVRKYQPDIVVNPRSGWCGDYTCEEGGGTVKGAIRSGVVEKCMSLTPGWGYTQMAEDPQRVSSLQNIKKLCADCIVRNMCFLINVGPDRHGNIPPNTEQRLLEFGSWVNEVSEAIYGTRGGPWNPVDGQYGFCYKDNTIYIYLLGDYSNSTFTLPLVDKGMKAVKAYLVSTKEKVSFNQKGQEITLKNLKPQKGEIIVIGVTLNKNVVHKEPTKEGVKYYIDARNGNDANNGLSEKQAWKSISKANQTQLNAGDKLLFRRGSTFRGILEINAKGRPDRRIVIDAYGKGKKPCITAPDSALYTICIRNSDYITLQNMEVINTGSKRMPHRTGVKVVSDNHGTSHHIILNALEIHDVNGSLIKNEGGGSGILIQNKWKDLVSVFDSLTIENCVIRRCERNAIIWSAPWSRKNWHLSTNTVVRKNLIEEVPGDGIVPIGCNGALVEYNLMRNCTNLLPDGQAAAGIWPWSCDSTTIQFNEVSDHKAPWDGQGFDSDFNCTQTTIQYNYSHDNDGGFILICNAGKGETNPVDNIGNKGSVVQYNISINDAIRPRKTHIGIFSPTIHISGPCDNTLIKNNILHSNLKPESHIDRKMVTSNSWGGYANNTTFKENVFYAPEPSAFNLTKSTHNTFNGNYYLGTFSDRPEDNLGYLNSTYYSSLIKKDPEGFKALSHLFEDIIVGDGAAVLKAVKPKKIHSFFEKMK